MTRLVGIVENFDEKITRSDNKIFYEWRFDVLLDDNNSEKIHVMMHGTEPSFKLKEKTRVRLYGLPVKDTNNIEKIDDLTNNVIIKFLDNKMPEPSPKTSHKDIIPIMLISYMVILVTLQTQTHFITRLF